MVTKNESVDLFDLNTDNADNFVLGHQPLEKTETKQPVIQVLQPDNSDVQTLLNCGR